MSFVQLKDENGSAIIPNAPLPIVEIQGSSGTIALDSGYVYIAGVLTALTFTLTAPSDPDYAAEYHLIFTTHSNGINITWPQNLIFEGATQAPTLEANTTYKIEIIDILCSVSVFGVDTDYHPFVGATSSTNGSEGLVPAPAAGDQDKFLKGDGTWGNASGGGGIGASVIGSYNPSYVNITDSNNNILIPFSTDPTEHITGDPNPSLSLEPNIIYVCDTLDSLTFTLNPPQYNPNGDYNDEYFISFESGVTPTTVTWPGGLIFANNSSAPTIVDNAHYEISIRDNLCIVQVFGVNTGGGGGGGGSVTFDEVGSYTPKFGNLRDNGNLILPHTLKPIVAVSGSTPTVAMEDGYVYVCGSITELTFTLTVSQILDYVAEYEIRFESGNTATIVNWPSGLTFENRPVIEPNSYTHICITDGNVKCFNYADVSAYTVGTNARVSFDTLTYQQIYDIVENA